VTGGKRYQIDITRSRIARIASESCFDALFVATLRR